MKELKQKHFFRDIFLSRFVFACFLGIIILFSFSVFNIYKKSQEAALKNRALEKELAELEQRRDNLGANINRLETETGVEEELRSKFQVKKPGEEYVVILESPSQSPQESASTTEKQKSFFKKFIEFFDVF